MELSIGQVAKRTGLSSRMLRHYDEIGLFRPSRVGASGYRWYDQATMPRLFRIIALRRSGLGLAEIGEIVVDGAGEAEALRDHLTELRAQHQRLGELVASIEDEVARLDAATASDPEQLTEDYRRERIAFAERLDAQHGSRAAATLLDTTDGDALTAADMEHMAAQNARLMNVFVGLMTSGLPPSAPEALDAVADHFAAVSRQWTPDARSYRALGRLYATDPLQRSITAEVHPDLPQWLADAIVAFADTRLGSQP